MILFKRFHLFDPEDRGIVDLLIGSGKVLVVGENLDVEGLPHVEVIEGHGCRLIPGLVDGHVHFNGAGGEGGPCSRTPEMHASTFFAGGVTTAVGCLGFDGYLRSLKELLMKTKALRFQGMGAWMYTGAYQCPPPSIFESVVEDIALLDEVVGVGEVAVSDHRSSLPTSLELNRLIRQTRNGGMLGGKVGILHLHMGDDPHPFRIIHEAVELGGVGYSSIVPTHCGRNKHIFEDALDYGRRGLVDLTTSSYPFFQDIEVKPSRGLARLLAAGVPLSHISLSSDAGGSLPAFDEHGKCIALESGEPSSMLRELLDAEAEGVPFQVALKTVTINPAKNLGLSRKGSLKPGCDADLVILKGRDLIATYASGKKRG